MDLAADGVTGNDSNDPDSRANNAQNFHAASDGVTTWVQGSLNSTTRTTFVIEFFANATCDPSGNGEGQTFLGSTQVSTGNVTNTVVFSVSLPVATPVGQFVTGVATNVSAILPGFTYMKN